MKICETGRVITGKTPSTKKTENWGDDVSFFAPEDIAKGYILDDSERHISEVGFNSVKNNTVTKGVSVLVGCIGSDMGNVALVEGKNAFNQQINAITDFKPDVNPFYVYYYLSTKKDYLRRLAGSTATPLLPKADFEQIEIPFVDKPVQDKIVAILKPIDEKIKLNNSICADLEAMSKQIYDYWFVQFDFPDKQGKPYKSSGGKMIYNEELKREIPFGWNNGNLYDIADFVNGLACQKYRPTDDSHKLPVVKITEMHNGITNKTEWVRDDIDSKHIIDDGTILFSWSATLEIMLWNGGKAGLNQHIFKVVPKVCSDAYVYHQLSAYVINFIRMAAARKTTMGHITTEHLEQSKIVIPKPEVLEAFQKTVDSTMKQISSIKAENWQLNNLRDFLLPMLMNGQIKIGG